MIVFENGTYRTHSLYPNTDFIPEDTNRHWTIPDNCELAQRIMSGCSFVPITDDAGELVDIQIPETNTDALTTDTESKPTIEQLQADILYLSMMTGIDLS